jgi:sulfatase maturation enzyme AslB (radical SAM superfamily)
MIIKRKLADNLLRLYGSVSRRLPLIPFKPILYFIYITRKCQLKCSYCWQKSPRREGDLGVLPEEELTPDEWCKFIEKLKAPAGIGFSGGEPLMYAGFEDVFMKAVSRFPVTINTNGLLLSEKISRIFVDNELRNISISIDGFRNIHDRTRNQKGLFDRVVENIKVLNEIKKKENKSHPSITVKTTLVDEVVEELADFSDFCDRELLADTLNISFAKTLFHAQFSQNLYDSYSDLQTAGYPESHDYKEPERVAGIVAGLLEKYAKGRMKIITFPSMNSSSQIKNYLSTKGHGIYNKCSVPWAMTVIMPSGEVVPCLSLRMGSLRDTDYNIAPILRGAKYKKFLSDQVKMQAQGNIPPECNCCCFLKVND